MSPYREAQATEPQPPNEDEPLWSLASYNHCVRVLVPVYDPVHRKRWMRHFTIVNGAKALVVDDPETSPYEPTETERGVLDEMLLKLGTVNVKLEWEDWTKAAWGTVP